MGMDMVLDTELLDMVTDHMDTQLMDIMERDLLMLSQRLMLTTDTVLDTALLDMVTDYGYPAYGYYGKRSADAKPEADAYYGYGLGYSTLGYGYRLRIPSLWILWKEIC